MNLSRSVVLVFLFHFDSVASLELVPVFPPFLLPHEFHLCLSVSSFLDCSSLCVYGCFAVRCHLFVVVSSLVPDLFCFSFVPFESWSVY